MTIEQKVMEFIALPVPPAGTPEHDTWVSQCRALGGESIPSHVSILEITRDENAQYAAILGIRIHGGDAYIGPENENEVYYRLPEEEKYHKIVSKIPFRKI